MTPKMEHHFLGGFKDFVAFVLSFSLLNIFTIEPVIITGLFALGGVVLGRVLDWVREDWKERRKKKKPNKFLKS